MARVCLIVIPASVMILLGFVLYHMAHLGTAGRDFYVQHPRLIIRAFYFSLLITAAALGYAARLSFQ